MLHPGHSHYRPCAERGFGHDPVQPFLVSKERSFAHFRAALPGLQLSTEPGGAGKAGG